jgi:hypothetical protein
MKDESSFDIKQLINGQKKFEEEIKKTLLFQQIKSFIKEYYDTNELFDLKKAISDFTKFEEFEIPEESKYDINVYFQFAIEALKEEGFISVRAYDKTNGNVYRMNTWGERIYLLKEQMKSDREAEDSLNIEFESNIQQSVEER